MVGRRECVRKRAHAQLQFLLPGLNSYFSPSKTANRGVSIQLEMNQSEH